MPLKKIKQPRLTEGAFGGHKKELNKILMSIEKKLRQLESEIIAIKIEVKTNADPESEPTQKNVNTMSLPDNRG